MMKKTIVMILALTVGMTVKAAVIEISTKSELLSFMSSWSNSNTYKLTADIDLENDSWTPVGQPNTNEFNTTFDGQGHKISNIKVEATNKSALNSGLFGVIGTSGRVQNLTIENGEIHIYQDETEYATQCGAIAGINRGTITDCTNKNTAVYGNHHSASVGGIAGDNYGTINNCYNFYGEVYTYYNTERNEGYTANFLGGITGVNYSGATVSNCFVCAKIAKNLHDGGKYGPIIADEKNFGTATNNSHEDYDGTNTTIPGYTLYKDGAWNTLCLPFELNEGQVTAQLNPTSLMELDTEGWYDNTGTPYATEAEGRRQTSFEPSTGTLYLYFKNATAIEAGKPYIIRWDKAEGYDAADPAVRDIVNPTFTDVTIGSLSLQNVTKNLGSGMSITFKGCFIPVSVSGPSYLFLSSNDELYYPSSARIIGSCRAYFELSGLTAGKPDPVSGARSIRAFSLNFNDESTGIVEVRKEEGEGNHVNASLPEYFTINGVKLTGKPTAKGLYIRSTPAGQQGKKDSRIIVIK